VLDTLLFEIACGICGAQAQ